MRKFEFVAKTQFLLIWVLNSSSLCSKVWILSENSWILVFIFPNISVEIAVSCSSDLGTVMLFKETIISVISSDPPCNARFTTVPSGFVSFKYELDINVFFLIIWTVFIVCGFSAKVICAFLVLQLQWRN